MTDELAADVDRVIDVKVAKGYLYGREDEGGDWARYFTRDAFIARWIESGASWLRLKDVYDTMIREALRKPCMVDIKPRLACGEPMFDGACPTHGPVSP